MKKLTKFFLIIIGFLLTVHVPLARAQIDMKKMHRDIDMAENILGKMFETKWEGETNVTRIFANYARNFDSQNVQGIYLSDYGVLFMITGTKPLVITLGNDKNKRNNYFVNGDDNHKTPVNSETITSRIIDFISSYGLTINQLGNNAKITVVYQPNRFEGLVSINHQRDESRQKQQLPQITVTAKVSDLKAYKRGRINKSKFKDRLIINKSKIRSKQDLKIMANILETAFEGPDKNEFAISDGIKYMAIKNFGALFSFEISYGDPFGVSRKIKVLGNKLKGKQLKGAFLKTKLDSVKKALSISKVKMDSLYSSFSKVDWDSLYLAMDSLTARLDSVMKNINFDSLAAQKYSIKLESLPDSQSNVFVVNGKKAAPTVSAKVTVAKHNDKYTDENAKKAFQQFMGQLKEIIVQYGPTLNSISSGENIVFSVDVNASADELPDRCVLSVKKST